MTPKELLDIELMKRLESKYKPKPVKKIRFKRVTRTLHPRLGKEYWREHYKTIKKNKKYLNKLKKRAGRKRHITGCPTRYKTYIISKWWEERKNRYYQAHGRYCIVCKHSGLVQLHHKFYGNYGNEKDSDLVALCGFHHEQIHLAIGKVKKDMRKITDSFIAEMKNADKVVEPFLDF